MKRLLLFILPPLIPLFSYTMEIQQKNLFVPKALGKLSVVKDNDHFTIVKNGKSFSVEPDRLDSALRKMDKKKLAAFLKTGYLSVNKSTDGSYSLQSQTRKKGGGPILSSVFYWGTKAVCYGAVFGVMAFSAKQIINKTDSGNEFVKGCAVDGTAWKVGEKLGGHVISQSIEQCGSLTPNAMGNLMGATTIAVSNSESTANAISCVMSITQSQEMKFGLGIVGMIEGISMAAGAVGAWIPWL